MFFCLSFGEAFNFKSGLKFILSSAESCQLSCAYCLHGLSLPILMLLFYVFISKTVHSLIIGSCFVLVGSFFILIGLFSSVTVNIIIDLLEIVFTFLLLAIFVSSGFCSSFGPFLPGQSSLFF